MRLQADGVDHRIRANAGGHFRKRLAHVDLAIVEDLGADPFR